MPGLSACSWTWISSANERELCPPHLKLNLREYDAAAEKIPARFLPSRTILNLPNSLEFFRSSTATSINGRIVHCGEQTLIFTRVNADRVVDHETQLDRAADTDSRSSSARRLSSPFDSGARLSVIHRVAHHTSRVSFLLGGLIQRDHSRSVVPLMKTAHRDLDYLWPVVTSIAGDLHTDSFSPLAYTLRSGKPSDCTRPWSAH